MESVKLSEKLELFNETNYKKVNIMLKAQNKDPNNLKNYATFEYKHHLQNNDVLHIPYDNSLTIDFPSQVNDYNRDMNKLGDSLIARDKVFAVSAARKLASRKQGLSWLVRDVSVDMDVDDYGRTVLIITKIVDGNSEYRDIVDTISDLVDVTNHDCIAYNHDLYNYLKKCFADHINMSTGPYTNLDKEYIEVTNISVHIPDYNRSSRYEFYISLCFHKLVEDEYFDDDYDDNIDDDIYDDDLI